MQPQVKPWMWEPFADSSTWVAMWVSLLNTSESMLGGNGDQAFWLLVKKIVQESICGSHTSSWILDRISCQWVSFSLRGWGILPSLCRSTVCTLVPQTEMPLSTKHFMCVSLELCNSLLSIGTIVILILEVEMCSERHSNWTNVIQRIRGKRGLKSRFIWSHMPGYLPITLADGKRFSPLKSNCFGTSWERWELRKVLRALLFSTSAPISVSSCYGFRDKDCFPRMSVFHYRPQWD